MTFSQPLVDSVNSSRQVENKLLRPIISLSLRWCDTKVCVADMLTKKGSSLTGTAMKILQTGNMIDLSQRGKIVWRE